MSGKNGLFLVIMASILAACTTKHNFDTQSIETAVRGVMNDQVKAWNEGNVEAYMNGYYKSDSLRFASGGTITLGWQFVLDRYKKRYSSRALMGQLTFSDLDVTIVSPDAAIAFGKWQLQRENDSPGGLFTLLFRKTDQGWRIVHDHTSAAVEE